MKIPAHQAYDMLRHNIDRFDLIESLDSTYKVKAIREGIITNPQERLKILEAIAFEDKVLLYHTGALAPEEKVSIEEIVAKNTYWNDGNFHWLTFINLTEDQKEKIITSIIQYCNEELLYKFYESSSYKAFAVEQQEKIKQELLKEPRMALKFLRGTSKVQKEDKVRAVQSIFTVGSYTYTLLADNRKLISDQEFIEGLKKIASLKSYLKKLFNEQRIYLSKFHYSVIAETVIALNDLDLIEIAYTYIYDNNIREKLEPAAVMAKLTH